MGRKRLQDGLEELKLWAVETGLCQPTTARTYVSSVRKVIREVGEEPDAAAIDLYFEEAYLHDDSYSNLKAAWKVYSAWRLAAEGVEVPTYDRKRPRTRSHQALPPLSTAVRLALRGLISSALTVRDISQLTWTDVTLKEIKEQAQGFVHISVPGQPNTDWRCRRKDVRALWDYAQVGRDLWKPLVPRTPGSNQRYPYRSLLKESQTIEAEEVEALFAPDEEVAMAMVPATSSKQAYASRFMAKKEKGEDLLRDLLASGKIGRREEEEEE